MCSIFNWFRVSLKPFNTWKVSTVGLPAPMLVPPTATCVGTNCTVWHGTGSRVRCASSRVIGGVCSAYIPPASGPLGAVCQQLGWTLNRMWVKRHLLPSSLYDWFAAVFNSPRVARGEPTCRLQVLCLWTNLWNSEETQRLQMYLVQAHCKQLATPPPHTHTLCYRVQ